MNKIINMLSPEMYLKLKILKNKETVKRFEKHIEANRKYKDTHKGERCFILASGPSVNNIDFSLLSDEVTFTVNQMARNPQFEKLKTNYHLWADRIFFEIDDNNDEDLEMLEVIKSVNEKSPSAEVFYEVTAMQMIERFHLEENNNINYFQVLGLDTKHVERAIVDFTKPVPNYPTVVDTVILLAVYMGFSEIYLLGCDCTGIVNIVQNKIQDAKNSLYAFEMTEAAAKRMERFAKQRKIKDELHSQAEMFEKYEDLREYCSRNGVRLYNASEGGILDCIERVRLEEVLSK